jgi:hypothetical protein
MMDVFVICTPAALASRSTTKDCFQLARRSRTWLCSSGTVYQGLTLPGFSA